MYYKIRVLLDTENDVFRDIEIAGNATFETLHRAILDAFEWRADQMASFYESNENWDRGREIPLIDLDEEFGPSKLRTMAEIRLSEVLVAVEQKMIYVFDFLLMWCFYVEVEQIVTDGECPEPRVVVTVGKAPDQSQKEPVDFKGDDPILARLPDEDDLEDEDRDEDEFRGEFSDFGEDDYR
jgi:hypothetical protein